MPIDDNQRFYHVLNFFVFHIFTHIISMIVSDGASNTSTAISFAGNRKGKQFKIQGEPKK